MEIFFFENSSEYFFKASVVNFAEGSFKNIFRSFYVILSDFLSGVPLENFSIVSNSFNRLCRFFFQEFLREFLQNSSKHFCQSSLSNFWSYSDKFLNSFQDSFQIYFVNCFSSTSGNSFRSSFGNYLMSSEIPSQCFLQERPNGEERASDADLLIQSKSGLLIQFKCSSNTLG